MTTSPGYLKIPHDLLKRFQNADIQVVLGSAGGTWLTEDMVRALSKEDLLKLAAENTLILSAK